MKKSEFRQKWKNQNQQDNPLNAFLTQANQNFNTTKINYQSLKSNDSKALNPFKKYLKPQKTQPQVKKRNQQHSFNANQMKPIAETKNSIQITKKMCQTKISHFFPRNPNKMMQKIVQITKQADKKDVQGQSQAELTKGKLKQKLLQIIKKKHEKQLQVCKTQKKMQFLLCQRPIEIENQKYEAQKAPQKQHQVQNEPTAISIIPKHNLDINLFTQIKCSRSNNMIVNLLHGHKFRQKVPPIEPFKYYSKSLKPQKSEKYRKEEQQQFTPQSSYQLKKVQQETQKGSDRKSKRIEKYQRLKQLRPKTNKYLCCQQRNYSNDNSSQMFEQSDQGKQAQQITKRDIKIAKMLQKWNESTALTCQLQYSENQQDIFDMIKNCKGIASATIKIVEGVIYYSLVCNNKGDRRLLNRQKIVRINPNWLWSFYKLRI